MNCWSLLISYCRWSCHTALFFIITCRFKGQTTNYRQKYLFNCLIVCLWHNSHNEASGLLFIYACISTGHTHFENNKVHISWEPKRPAMLFSVVKWPKNPLGSRVQSLWRVALPGFQLRKKTRLWAKVYQCVSVLEALFMGCFYQLMAWHRKTNKIYKHACKHLCMHTYTYILKNNFKPGVCPLRLV